MNSCTKCGNNGSDLSGATQVLKLKKIINFNYTLIGTSIIVISILLLIIYYFGNELYSVIKKYREQKKILVENIGKKVNTDDEIYDDLKVNTTMYFDKNKSKYLENMDKDYKDYNKTKSKFIKTNYNKVNDDLIDQNILYEKNDDYNYNN